MTFTLIELFGGIVYLLMAGDLLVRGAVALARRARIPPLLVAITLVAFGTSLPELVVSVQAVFAGHPNIAIGNVVGSNIANVLLVAGAPAIIFPLACRRGTTRRDSTVMAGVSVGFFLLCLTGQLHREAGALLLTGFAVLSALTARQAAAAHEDADRAAVMEAVLGLPTSAGMIGLFIVAGAVGLPLGARLLIEAAVQVASSLGVADTVVGLTIVAVGTSMPELATTLVAATKRHTHVAVGTVIGSNIFNLLAIMGIAAIVTPRPIPVPPEFLRLDLLVMLGSALLLTFFTWRHRFIGRVAGIFLVAAYAGYVVLLYRPS